MGVLIDTNDPERIWGFILDTEVYWGHNDLETFLGDNVLCMKEWLMWPLRVFKLCDLFYPTQAQYQLYVPPGLKLKKKASFCLNIN